MIKRAAIKSIRGLITQHTHSTWGAESHSMALHLRGFGPGEVTAAGMHVGRAVELVQPADLDDLCNTARRAQSAAAVLEDVSLSIEERADIALSYLLDRPDERTGIRPPTATVEG